MSDLTPCLFLRIKDALDANPGANAAWLAISLNLPREMIEAAMKLAGK